MRSRWCRACKQFHALDQPWPAACADHFASREAASDLAAPMLVRDGMDAVRSMADGKIYDSKSAYYGSVRRAGCEIVGDDIAGFGPRPEYRPQGVGQDIKRSIEMLKSGE